MEATKALTVRQPYAAWMFVANALGLKDVENRSWQTRHRGRLAIHTALLPEHWWSDTEAWHLNGQRGTAWAFGAVIGVVDLARIDEPVRYVEGDPSVWALAGHYRWRLADPVLLDEPVLSEGGEDVFDLAPDVARRVRELLGG